MICRARWRERREVDRYLNLAEVVGEEEDTLSVDGGDGRGSCGDGAPG